MSVLTVTAGTPASLRESSRAAMRLLLIGWMTSAETVPSSASISSSCRVSLWPHMVLTIMDTPVEIFSFSREYLRFILIGVPFLAVYNLFAALLRAVGNTRAAFSAVLLSSALNVILDILFVIVWSFGVSGAAAATVLSQAAMTVFIIFYTAKFHPQLMPKRGTPFFSKDTVRDGTAFGLPPALQNSAASLGNLILQNFMNHFGAVTVLAITTAYRVDSIMFLPIINLGAAISNLTARAAGEGDPRRIRQYLHTGFFLMVGISGGLAIVMYLFGSGFVGFFGVSGAALEAGSLFFQDISVFYVLFGIATVFRSILEGTGDLAYCSAAGIITLILRIILSHFLKPLIGSRTIAIAEGISWLLLLFFMAIRFLQKRKKIFKNTGYPH